MALVEGVTAERKHRIPHFLDQRMVIAIGFTFREKLRFQSFHLLRHFLCHDTTDIVSTTQGVSAQNLGQFHHLFLVNNHTVGFAKYLFQVRVVTVNFFFTLLTGNKVGNLFQRPRTVQGVHSDKVKNSGRLQFSQVLLHTRRFKLEHRRGHALTQQVKGFLVVQRDMAHVQLDATVLLDHVHRVLNDGQVDKTQEVHLQKSDIFGVMLVVHHHRRIFGSGTV